MHLITYMSDYTGTDDQVKQDLVNITKTAKVENALREITGVLFYMEGKFLQVMEGEEDVLRSLMLNIEKDPRHKNIIYLIDTSIENAVFMIGIWIALIFPTAKNSMLITCVRFQIAFHKIFCHALTH